MFLLLMQSHDWGEGNLVCFNTYSLIYLKGGLKNSVHFAYRTRSG